LRGVHETLIERQRTEKKPFSLLTRFDSGHHAREREHADMLINKSDDGKALLDSTTMDKAP
jgi:hypothetical protein